MKYIKKFNENEKFNENVKFNVGDIAYYNDILDYNSKHYKGEYEIIKTKMLDNHQYVVAKNIKNGYYRNDLFYEDVPGFLDTICWIDSDLFEKELEHVAKRYNI